MANCTECNKELTCDEIGLHKKLMGRAEEEFMCISCLARFFKCEEELMYRKIEHLLLEDEREVFKRAANSTHLNKPKHASVTDYRYATGFEAVIGMLVWIKDEERLEELLKEAHKENSENDTED